MGALAATAAAAVGNVVVAGFWRGYAAVEVVATAEAEVASILGSREATKKHRGELGRVGTLKN